ncbi:MULTISPECIES: VOC family protein [Microbulbifer]|nr:MULTISPECIES: VOC family protein [Microbulbifer]
MMEQYLPWAEGDGPLMLADAAGQVHLALFESDKGPASTIAFGASGMEFLRWKGHLDACGAEVALSDHDLSWSLYFSDPDGNRHEITTYDYDAVKASLPTEP